VIGSPDRVVYIKNSTKEALTVCVAVTAGGKKLPSLFIKKAKTPRTLQNFAEHELVHWTFSESGWSTQATMVEWFECVLLPFTAGRPAVVVLDHFSAHWVAAVRRLARNNQIHLIKVPAGETPHLQPLDIAVMGPLKAGARRLWREAVVANPELKLGWMDGVSHFLQSYRQIHEGTIINAFTTAIGILADRVPPSPTAHLFRYREVHRPFHAVPLLKATTSNGKTYLFPLFCLFFAINRHATDLIFRGCDGVL
jgi:hypothetical protein